MTVRRGRAGATIIDDCYNANPSSMRAALEVLRTSPPGSLRIAVLGDMLELGDHAAREHEALGVLAARSADRLIALGSEAERVVEAARGAGLAATAAEVAVDTDDAVRRLRLLLDARTHVLVKGSRGMRLEGIVAALGEEA